MKAVLRTMLMAVTVVLVGVHQVGAQGFPEPLGLENTRWTGEEDLENYGRLEFRFQSGGQVTMIDSDGASVGVYRQEGLRVTLHFHDGRVVYHGVIDGSGMRGRASNGRTEWNFSTAMDAPSIPSPPRPR